MFSIDFVDVDKKTGKNQTMYSVDKQNELPYMMYNDYLDASNNNGKFLM